MKKANWIWSELTVWNRHITSVASHLDVFLATLQRNRTFAMVKQTLSSQGIINLLAQKLKAGGATLHARPNFGLHTS